MLYIILCMHNRISSMKFVDRSVWGGVPRYWELRENRNSLEDALWRNILSVNDPKLSLMNAPKDDAGNTMSPKDVVGFCY